MFAAAGCQATIHQQERPDAQTGHMMGPDGGPIPADAAVMIDAPAMMTATSFLTGWEKYYCDEAWACKNSYPNNGNPPFSSSFGNTNAGCYSIAAGYDNAPLVEMDITAGKITFSAAN